MNEQTNQPLFEDNSGALIARSDAAAVARATQEIQAALVIAQRFPRNVIAVKSKILEACQRKDLAEVAEYEYSRGGTRITGPTIDLLRAIANRWGNIRFGWCEVERRQGESSVRCFAWDCQTNGQSERTFTVKHWRDTSSGGYELTDERDIYEAMANMAARRVRACLEEIIDADVVNAAIDQCRVTLKSGEKTPLTDRAVKMLVPFGEFGVTQAMIEARLGNKLDAVSENQLASLRRVYKSLKDGVGKREDYFKPETVVPKFENAPGTTASPGGVSGEGEAVKSSPEPIVSVPEAVKPGNGGQNYLKAVRNLCAMAKIKEGVLVGFMSEIGLTDGSPGSLEEVQMTHPLALKVVHDSWADMAAKIHEATKGAA